MKKFIIREEEIKHIKKLYSLNKGLIIEASKLDILTKKIGLGSDAAKILDMLCGSLSVWMVNKLIDFSKTQNSSTLHNSKESIINRVNHMILSSTSPAGYRVSTEALIQGIMDYIRVGLNSDISTIKQLPYEELITKSNEWHDSLNSGKSKIDYKEREKSVILDYRDENGFGYYWVNLGTNECSEESERMGHCGRSQGQLYSLRQYIPAQNGHTINRSLLTASIDKSGILLQLKGSKNSKPDQKFHPYIVNLFKLKDTNGDFLIKSIESEYDNQSDFKVFDLNDNDFKTLYSLRPSLFNTRLSKERLYKLGLLSKEDFGNDVVSIPFNKMGKICEIVFSQDDYGFFEESDIFEIISDDDMFWDIWMESDLFNYEDSIQYINKTNLEHIWQIIRTISNENFDEYSDLENAIEEYDKDGLIEKVINKTYYNVTGIDFRSNIEEQISNSLENIYGPITINDFGFSIKINFSDFIIKNKMDVNLDNIFDNCNDDYLCVLETLLDDNVNNENRTYEISHSGGLGGWKNKSLPIINVNINHCISDSETNFDGLMFNRMLNDELNDL